MKITIRQQIPPNRFWRLVNASHQLSDWRTFFNSHLTSFDSPKHEVLTFSVAPIMCRAAAFEERLP